PPGASRRMLVQEIISSDRSKANVAPSLATNVRQVPFTAIDAPTGESADTVAHATTRRWSIRARTSPSSSTIPVNIGLQPEVVSDPLDGRELQPQRFGDRREPRAHHHGWGRSAPDEDRRDVEHDAVDQPIGDEAP